MKHNMNEETLMAYLYGECNAEERAQVEKYFNENPEELQKYKELLFVKDTLGKITDKEVIAPPIFMDDEKPVISLWRSNFVRYAPGIAAAFIMVMIGAKLLGLQINYSGNQLTLSFGAPVVKEVNTGLSSEQVQTMISSALNKNNEYVQTSWKESQNKVNETLKASAALTSSKIDELNKTSLQESREQIRSFMQNLQNQNNVALQEYLRLSSADQKQYIEGLLVDFTKYLQEQRNQDLNLVQSRIQTLEENNNQFRQEAGQILTSLISNNNNSTLNRN